MSAGSQRMSAWRICLASACLLAGLVLLLLPPSQASAGVPAICEEYPNLPQCEEGGGGGGGNEDPDEDAGGAGPTGDADGELPFTGYPLTSLLLLLLALLVAGLTLRAYLAIRGRVRGSPAADRSFVDY